MADEHKPTFSCRLCRAPVRLEAWGGAECAVCGSVSMQELPTHDEIAKFYANYNLTYAGGGASEGRNLVRYARRYVELVRLFAQTGRLIDIGSSKNPFPNHAAAAGFQTTAVDFVRPSGLDKDVEFIVGNMNSPTPDWIRASAFDVVTSWAVLEHVPDTQSAVHLLSSLCKPGGVIIVSTPETGTWLTRQALGHSPWFYPPEHLTLISPAAMIDQFKRNNCELLSWGRLEINAIRYFARYGIGWGGACLGTAVKTVAPGYWQHLRQTRKQRFQGVAYYVFRKPAGLVGH